MISQYADELSEEAARSQLYWFNILYYTYTYNYTDLTYYIIHIHTTILI